MMVPLLKQIGVQPRGLRLIQKVSFTFFSNESSLIIYAWTVMNINQDCCSLPSLGFNMGHPELLHLYYTSALLKRSRMMMQCCNIAESVRIPKRQEYVLPIFNTLKNVIIGKEIMDRIDVMYKRWARHISKQRLERDIRQFALL